MYKKLDIDFDIPEELEYYINKYIDDLNNHGGMDDCYRTEIDFCLKDWSNGLTDSQVQLLREYYVWEGIKK